jgi:hypothetical protein
VRRAFENLCVACFEYGMVAKPLEEPEASAAAAGSIANPQNKKRTQKPTHGMAPSKARAGAAARKVYDDNEALLCEKARRSASPDTKALFSDEGSSTQDDSDEDSNYRQSNDDSDSSDTSDTSDDDELPRLVRVYSTRARPGAPARPRAAEQKESDDKGTDDPDADEDEKGVGRVGGFENGCVGCFENGCVACYDNGCVGLLKTGVSVL